MLISRYAQMCTSSSPDVEQGHPQIPPEQLDTSSIMDGDIRDSKRPPYDGIYPEDGVFTNVQSGGPPEYSQISDPYSDYTSEPPNSPAGYGNDTLQAHRLGPPDAPLSSVDELEHLPGTLYPFRPSTMDSETLLESSGPGFLQWRNQRLAPWEHTEHEENYILKEDT